MHYTPALVYYSLKGSAAHTTASPKVAPLWVTRSRHRQCLLPARMAGQFAAGFVLLTLLLLPGAVSPSVGPSRASPLQEAWEIPWKTGDVSTSRAKRQNTLSARRLPARRKDLPPGGKSLRGRARFPQYFPCCLKGADAPPLRRQFLFLAFWGLSCLAVSTKSTF